MQNLQLSDVVLFADNNYNLQTGISNPSISTGFELQAKSLSKF